jgi:leader peptidase (prepilin peptidase)/N-methyltransferase
VPDFSSQSAGAGEGGSRTAVEPSEAGRPQPSGHSYAIMALRSVALTPVLRRLAVAYGVPFGSPPRGACPACGASVGLGAPGSALLPPGRCGSCGGRVGPLPYAVELVALLAVALGLLAVPRPGLLPAYAWWAALAVPLVFVDLAVHRLPDRLTYPAAAGVFLLSGLAGEGWLRGLLAGVGVGLLFGLSTLVLGRRGFGLGDAKLALSCAALLGTIGWGPVVLGLVLAFFSSGLVSVALLAARRVRWSTHLPFGPFLVIGTATALVLS